MSSLLTSRMDWYPVLRSKSLKKAFTQTGTKWYTREDDRVCLQIGPVGQLKSGLVVSSRSAPCVDCVYAAGTSPNRSRTREQQTSSPLRIRHRTLKLDQSYVLPKTQHALLTRRLADSLHGYGAHTPRYTQKHTPRISVKRIRWRM